jgi:hypothetical protein
MSNDEPARKSILLTERPIPEFHIHLAKLQKLGVSPSKNLQFLTPNEFANYSTKWFKIVRKILFARVLFFSNSKFVMISLSKSSVNRYPGMLSGAELRVSILPWNKRIFDKRDAPFLFTGKGAENAVFKRTQAGLDDALTFYYA